MKNHEPHSQATLQWGCLPFWRFWSAHTYLNLTKKFAVNLQGCCKTKKISFFEYIIYEIKQISDFFKGLRVQYMDR